MKHRGSVRPTPVASKPAVPDRAEYGEPDKDVARDDRGWLDVERRLQHCRYFWIATTRADGRPHSVPVCALWIRDRLYLATHPSTLTARNIARDGRVRAHTGDARVPIMIDGVMKRAEPTSIFAHIIDAYEARFGERLDPADPEMPFYVLTPSVAFSWDGTDVRNSITRWRFRRS